MVVSKRMTEANEQEQEQGQKRPLTLGRSGTLGLRRPVETGQVRQSFSHGRSKTVTVEVRKKRTVVPGAAAEPGHAEPTPVVARAPPRRYRRGRPTPPGRRTGRGRGAGARRGGGAQAGRRGRGPQTHRGGGEAALRN